MSAFTIRVFGDPVLKQRAREITEFDGALQQLSKGMIATMYEAPGLGLAAPQVGVSKRLFVADLGEGPFTVANPVVVESTGIWLYDEGCLSVPGVSFEIARPKVVTISYQDLDGNIQTMVGDELLGRLFLHEVDHLDGVLVLDRLDPDTRRAALKEIREADLDALAGSGESRLFGFGKSRTEAGAL